MLVKDIMTKKVITAPSSTTISEAKQIMREHGFHRLPVVDDGKLLGIVSEAKLERVSPKTTAPLLWQIGYVISHTTLRDVMVKEVVTIDPEATVEQGVALAQGRCVGALVVVRKGKVVGIATTNDFFYKIVNPTLGLGETGSRIIVPGAGDGKSAEKIITCINNLGVAIKLIWTLPSSKGKIKDIIVQVDTEDATSIIEELRKLGYSASVRPR